MEWFISVLKKYAVFSGRARRKEYWFFILFYFLIGLILTLLTLLPTTVGKFFQIVSIVYSLALFVPSLAVSVRRLHDIDRSGFSLFFGFIPLAGFIILLVFFTRDGTPGENRYGPSPKTADNENSTEDSKTQKRLLIALLIILVILSFPLSLYLGFRNISSKEIFTIINMSDKNYYLDVVSEKSISRLSFKKYEQVNDVKYTYICESGRHKLKTGIQIFECERNDDVDFVLKLKNIFSELRLVDENNNVILDINDDNMKKISIDTTKEFSRYVLQDDSMGKISISMSKFFMVFWSIDIN